MYTNQNGQKIGSEQPTSKSLTTVGECALAYVRRPNDFPRDCPDPRVDAKAFAEYINNLPGTKK